MTYNDAKEYLLSLQKRGIKYNLENIKNILKILDNPEKKFKTILVGGTNGKGSTTTFLSSVLVHSGYKVGTFTSPFLIEPTENIRYNLNEMSKEEFAFYTEELKNILNISYSYFEFLTAMALKYFKDKEIQIAILEVGLGGRLDSTNACDPIISIITNINYDHMDLLGTSLEKIAYEKAGIIRENGYLITAEIKKEVLKVFETETTKKKSHFYKINNDFSFFKNLKLNLVGDHQFYNASCAICAIEILKKMGFFIRDENLYNGLCNAHISCRLEKFTKKNAPDFLLDIAHNTNGIEILTQYINNYIKKPIPIIIGIMKDKEYKKMLSILKNQAKIMILTKPDYDRAWDLATIKSLALEFDHIFIPTIEKSINHALTQYLEEELIIITGSNFTVGEAKKILINLGFNSYYQK
jgi:dihydrofolate synthase/folylpolyglutamate synthase